MVTFLAGIATIVIFGLYAYQLDQLTGPLNDASRNVLSLDVFDLIGVGAYVCLAGGLAMVVGALVTRPKPPTPFAVDASDRTAPGPMTAAPPTWGAAADAPANVGCAAPGPVSVLADTPTDMGCAAAGTTSAGRTRDDLTCHRRARTPRSRSPRPRRTSPRTGGTRRTA